MLTRKTRKALTVAEKIEILNKIAAGAADQVAIANEYGVTSSAISKIMPTMSSI